MNTPGPEVGRMPDGTGKDPASALAKPTAQARKAAEEITAARRVAATFDCVLSRQELARIIDSATGLPGLVEALRSLLDTVGGAHDAWAALGIGHDPATCDICKARAALQGEST